MINISSEAAIKSDEMKRLLIIFSVIFVVNVHAQNDETVYRTPEVDVKPQLESGMYMLTMFVSDNFKFPELRNKNVKIFASFIIEKDGTMNDEKAFSIVAKDYLPGDQSAITEEQKAREAEALEQMKLEAQRVLALFEEKWVPAQLNGVPVRCLYNYPITFNLE